MKINYTDIVSFLDFQLTKILGFLPQMWQRVTYNYTLENKY